jgi:hypothetical protein
MENLFKQLVKEAVLEALNEFANGGIALAIEDPTNSSLDEKKDEGEGENKSNDGKGEGSKESSGGGEGPGGKPKPDVGVGVFGLR